MTKPNKKPKTGDIVSWCVIDPNLHEVDYEFAYRSDARATLAVLKLDESKKNYRLAKIVLAK